MPAGWRQSAGRHCEVVTWGATAWDSLIPWTVRDTLTLTQSREKPLHQHGDHLDFLIQGEVTGIQEMHCCRRHFAGKGQGTGHREERIVLPPHDERWRLVRAQVGLPTRIGCDIRPTLLLASGVFCSHVVRALELLF
jgi:hypothetical protein